MSGHGRSDTRRSGSKTPSAPKASPDTARREGFRRSGKEKSPRRRQAREEQKTERVFSVAEASEQTRHGGLFDTAFAILRRVLSGRSPLSPDRGHVHHRLIDMGFNQKQAVAILYVISVVLGLIAVVLTTSGELRAMVLVAAVIIGLVVSGLLFLSNGQHKIEESERRHRQELAEQQEQTEEPHEND